MFFAYLGLAPLDTGAEESRNPRRDLPLAIFSSPVTATVGAAYSSPTRQTSPAAHSPHDPDAQTSPAQTNEGP